MMFAGSSFSAGRKNMRDNQSKHHVDSRLCIADNVIAS